MDNRLKIPFGSEINAGDTENQTYGCRANNPDICSNNQLEGICAFVTEDGICKKPSRAWKKKYQELSRLNKNDQHKKV
jgi:hypothetical protein